jgi:hypothetical protein
MVFIIQQAELLFDFEKLDLARKHKNCRFGLVTLHDKVLVPFF